MAAESQLNPTQPVNQQIYRILRRDIVHCLIRTVHRCRRKKSPCVLRCLVSRCAKPSLSWRKTDLSRFVPSAVATSIKSHCRRCVMVASSAAIECAVVRRAAGMINEEQLYQLEQNLHQQRIAVDRQQLNDFSCSMMNFTRSCRLSPTVSWHGRRWKILKPPSIASAI